MADAKAVRRYQAGIERALALFDATNEWADYIAFLSRLLKALQNPPEHADIPLKSTIARYIAQCLRPSLPSGVHQKALEVYDLIFSIIGPLVLGEDLSLYLPGLSHTLAFASLSTRPQFLAIYDDYILALPAATLRPAVRALVMSLLPGIEEETSEDFEKTLSTFNRLRTKFAEDDHEEIFWQNLFLASITSSNRRPGVLVYLVRYLPKLPSQIRQQQNNKENSALDDVVKAVVTPEPGLLVRCFATGLQDQQPLIQRGFLDLLVSHLPLDATIFANNAHIGDLDVLVDASAAVVLKRDMSLNRRLWAWYTGSEARATNSNDTDANDTPTSPAASKVHMQDATYFEKYGLASLVRSISSMLRQPSQEPGYRARPFRIALSLMDRWEIGGPVVQSQFVPLLESLQLYQASAPSQEAFDEVYRSANVFFDGVESRLIAFQLLSLLDRERLDLVLFIVSDFNLEEEDMMKNHVPSICLFIVESIRQSLAQRDRLQTQTTITVEDKLGQILEVLLLLVPSGTLQNLQDLGDNHKDLKRHILNNYTLQSSRVNGMNGRHNISNDLIGSALLEGLFECLQQVLSGESIQSTLTGHMFACLDQCIALVQSTHTLERIRFLPRLLNNIRTLEPLSSGQRYQILTGIARLITTLSSRDPQKTVLTSQELCTLIPLLIDQLWYFLLSSTPQYHVEAVECIWQLHAISQSLRLAESKLISLLITELSQSSEREYCMQRFGTLWIHSRLAAKQLQGLKIEQPGLGGDDVLDLLQYPLLQVIDAADGSLSSHPCSVWMSSLASLNTLFGVVFLQMPKDMTDSSSMAIALQRLGKLISITKANDAQWKAFSGKTGHRDAVFELCSSLTSNQAVVNSLGVEALQIVRILIGSEGMEMGDDILKMLSTRLVASNQLEEFQDSLLDTLQLAFSTSQPSSQPDWLIPILLDGISNTSIDFNLDKWITLLCTIVPLLGTSNLFSNLLKITSCLCKRIELYFRTLQDSFVNDTKTIGDSGEMSTVSANNPERSISSLLSGMEYVLARAHHQAALPRNEQLAGANGLTTDLPTSRSFANDHLTVVLCMQDALKVCSKLWIWRSAGKVTTTAMDTKSLHYMTSRLRARSRRILENLVEAEPQESLETLMGLWVDKRVQNSQHHQVLELLQTLDGARPKFMMPATFNAIYNRTNPSALDQSQRSSLSVNVNAFELIAFLNDYTSALEDDLLDEIWTDCTAFLKEILANPMPHRSILLKLLEFTSVLCRKMENTNFGEETRMRRELADLCTRLFTAIFTIKPQGLDGSGSKVVDIQAVFEKKPSHTRSSVQPSNALQILQDTLPDLALVLSQSDRLATVYVGIATNVTGPLLHSRTYPQNVSAELLALLQTMSTAPAAIKAWRKDVTDAFNDAKFFQNQIQLVEPGWLPLLRQVALTDKALMTELISRLAPPAAAGLMFGVGASAARTEADKKTQSTLRRISLLCLSVEVDHFVPNLQTLLVKLEELLTATPESSPSSNSKTDVYMMLRTILLTFSQTQLSAFWPLIDSELRELCGALISKDFTKFTLSAQLQGAKLLDVLLLMKPDEFQLHEWLFVTDTMDAIYPPSGIPSVALADQIVLKPSIQHIDAHPSSPDVSRKPSLCTDQSRDDQKTESLLAAFFSQLSIRTYEDSYNLRHIDLKACREDLLKDLFVD